MKKEQSQRQRLQNLVFTALFAALITALTSLHVPTGSFGGYIHVGDSMVYLVACILPLPYAAAAAGLGGALADLLAGSVAWAPFTLVIKSLNVLPFALVYSLKRTKNPGRILNGATAVMPFVSGLVTVAGYLLPGRLISGSFKVALLAVPPNMIQAVGSAVIYYAAGAALDRIGFKNKVLGTK